MKHARTLFDIPLNPSVKEKDELRLSKQAKELYDLLGLGPVTTGEAAAIACQYNARFNEIRATLMDMGLTVDMTEGQGGNNSYEIVNFKGSKYQAHLRKKGYYGKENQKENRKGKVPETTEAETQNNSAIVVT